MLHSPTCMHPFTCATVNVLLQRDLSATEATPELLLCTSFNHLVVGLQVQQYVSPQIDVPLLVASFGASAVLLFGIPEAKLAQPRAFVGGQVCRGPRLFAINAHSILIKSI